MIMTCLMIVYIFLNDHRWVHGHDLSHDYLYIPKMTISQLMIMTRPMIIYLFLNDHRWTHGHDSRHDHLFIYILIFLYDHFGSVPPVKSWPQKQTTHVEKGGGRGWGFYSRQMPAGGGGNLHTNSAHVAPFCKIFVQSPPPLTANDEKFTELFPMQL